MKLLNLSFTSPAENLAADEVLLELCEAGNANETLVFWEPQSTFVVVGYANKVATEVNVEACESCGVPIFRRCSGGGTVVQMEGGLNYSLILRITETGPTRNITAANQFIMEKNRAAVAGLLPAATVSVRGHTDLCVGDLKFAGNAQRRRKNFLLFHGTLLLDCDLTLIGELLRMPSLQPDYRASRPHENFVTNLNLPAAAVKAALAKVWDADEPAPALPTAEVARLVAEKYLVDGWNRKF
ncbi:MAG TPA: lipoate--protein ligase family protein [Verrucomicrobiae bacterium]|nr:lipoate--protein ligase family protein [Verrucomicrobiae bacterium]